MKITYDAATKKLALQSEHPSELFLLGRIAAKIKDSYTSAYPEGQQTVELDIGWVLEKLAQ